MSPLIPLAAFVTHGIESLAAQEIRGAFYLNANAVTERPKVILFSTAEKLTALKRLRTVDDICVAAFTDESAAELSGFLERLDAVDIESLVQVAGRQDSFDGTFSVTVSAARSPLGATADLEPAVRTAIEQRYGWKGCVGTRGSVDVRVFCDGTWALVGIRIFDQPLSHRAYRITHVPGALRPPVAAALVRLACPDNARHRVWDPFCGSGTILCEASLAGHEVRGTDIDKEAVAAACDNLGTLDRALSSHVELADSTSVKTWRRHARADVVVTNLPWGKQISIERKQKLYDAIQDGIADLLKRGGRVVLLTTEPERACSRLRRLKTVSIQERRIGLLGQSPTIVSISAAPGPMLK
jgi:tRNA (guanine6-N2)-methyltransferase